jgi:hypothetical protein
MVKSKVAAVESAVESAPVASDVVESVRKDPEKGPEEKPAVEALFDEADESDESVTKFRWLVKGTALEALMKVMGVVAVKGEKQVALKVGERELGDVLRTLFGKMAEKGITLRDLISLLKKAPETPKS